MSNPPSPLAALTGEIHRWAAVLARTARNVADGEIPLAAAVLDAAAARLQELREELLTLEAHELPQRLPGLDDAPRAGAAKLPDPGSNHSHPAHSRAQGPSIASNRDTGFADEPLF